MILEKISWSFLLAYKILSEVRKRMQFIFECSILLSLALLSH
jgi:hypothetical protein